MFIDIDAGSSGHSLKESVGGALCSSGIGIRQDQIRSSLAGGDGSHEASRGGADDRDIAVHR